MRDSLRTLCDQFIQNRDIMKKVFAMDSSYIYPVCAAIATDKGKVVNAEELQKCKDMLKAQTGVFSTFRGNSRAATITMLAVDVSPEEKLVKALIIYDLFKKHFWANEYLPMASMVIADLLEPEQYTETIDKTKRIYDLMKQEHPFLTGGEDTVYATLLAMSDMTDAQIVRETESCYQLLKQEFFDRNAVQALSHVLALCDGSSEQKCRRTIQLYNGLKEKGCKYGTDYELATLGILAMLPVDQQQIMKDIMEVDQFLKGQKGYGFFGCDRAQRLMHASMLVVSDYMDEENNSVMSTAAVSSTISLIVAQQTALCASIAAANAAAASNASN
jgi:hypothetical protein